MTSPVLSLCVLLALAGPAAADARDDARARFDRGQTLYNLGKLDEAIAEFDAAYQLDPDPVYLFNLAQAHRLKGTSERALFFYRRYLDLWSEAPNRAEVEQRIATLESELVAAKVAADKAAADKAVADKAAADKAAADKAATDKAIADKAAADAAATARKRIRLGVDVGWSLIYLNGTDESRQTQLTERVLLAYLFHAGAWTFDAGALFQLTTVQYVGLEGSDHVSYSQLHAIGAVSRPLIGSLSARLAIGVGRATLFNLDAMNPLTEGGIARSRQSMWALRSDMHLLYKISGQRPQLDFALSFAGLSVASRGSAGLRADLDRVITLEGLYLGLFASF